MTANLPRFEIKDPEVSIHRGANREGDRYEYDWGECSAANGFAQIDTAQDASYYGTWANPFKRAIFSYCEGDLTLTLCKTDAAFVREIRECHSWNVEHGWGMKIDGMCDEKIIAKFTELGLADLLH